MPDEASRVREIAKSLAKRHPGRTIEVRVPPFVAIQVGFGDGSTHRRGTPPNVVEMDAGTFLSLASGELAWDDADPARLRCSGVHSSDLRAAFPLPKSE